MGWDESFYKLCRTFVLKSSVESTGEVHKSPGIVPYP